MAGLTHFMETQVLNHLFRTATLSKLTNVYLALMITPIADDGTGGTEVSTVGTAYARQQIPVADASWSAPAGAPRAISNLADIVFPVPTASWGTITGWALYDALSGGNAVLSGVLESNKVVILGDPAPRFLASAFIITAN